MCGICAVFNLNGSNNGGGMSMKVTDEYYCIIKVSLIVNLKTFATKSSCMMFCI